MGRLRTPADIGTGRINRSTEAAWITGQLIDVDGGASLVDAHSLKFQGIAKAKTPAQHRDAIARRCSAGRSLRSPALFRVLGAALSGAPHPSAARNLFLLPLSVTVSRRMVTKSFSCKKNILAGHSRNSRSRHAELPQRVDVAIIGSGSPVFRRKIAAKSGATVAVFDSQPSAGAPVPAMADNVPHGLKLPAATLIDRYGKRSYRAHCTRVAGIHRFRRTISSRRKYRLRFARLRPPRSGLPKQNISTISAAPPTETARHFNHKQRIIPKNQLQSEIGSAIYHGGLVDATSAALNPARFVAGLAQAAERAGATIFEHSPRRPNSARRRQRLENRHVTRKLCAPKTSWSPLVATPAASLPRCKIK